METVNTNYYNGDKLLSYNAFFNLIIGGRGIGKTFFYKKMCLKNFITKGEQFIYLRRTQTELDTIDKDSFFPESILEQLYDDFKIIKTKSVKNATSLVFYGNGCDHNLFITSRKVTLDNKIVCYMKALSTWVKLKGSEYDHVQTILFDEVLIDMSSRSRYLPNEVDALMQLISSVFRNRTKTKIYCLSNATNFNNPYFLYFNFTENGNKEYYNLKKYGAVFEFPKNTALTMETNPNFYKLSRNSNVFESNANNAFQKAEVNNIGKIPGKKMRLYSIYADGTFLTVYLTSNDETYVAKGYDKNLDVYTFNINNIEMDFTYLIRSSPISQHIRNNFYNNLIYYQDIETKMKFQNEIKSII